MDEVLSLRNRSDSQEKPNKWLRTLNEYRQLPLIERKAMLNKLLKRKYSRILYLDHVEGGGRLLVEQIVAKDLEGIVCKRKHARSGRSLASSYFQCRSE